MIVYDSGDARDADHRGADAGASGPATWDALVARLLTTARVQLEMQAAFLCRFEGDEEIIDAISGAADSFGVAAGARVPSEDLYCAYMVDGRLDQVIPDVRSTPIAKDLAATEAANVGAYIGVPVRLPNGDLFGTMCCMSHDPQDSLRPRDALFLKTLADMLAEQIQAAPDAAATSERLERIERALREGISIVFQPIFDLATNTAVGFEALSRFPGEPPRPPNEWFAEAAEVGLGVELELAAARAAIEHLDEVPNDAYVSINFSPAALMSPDLRATLAGASPNRIVIELTEHTEVSDYAPLSAQLAALRREGYRLAVDDAGAGFSSFSHILRLAPDVIKLDRDLVAGIDLDASQRALASAIVTFSGQMNARVVAEGVENAQELSVLHDLGIGGGQGYFLARPAPLTELLVTIRDNRMRTYEHDAAA